MPGRRQALLPWCDHPLEFGLVKAEIIATAPVSLGLAMAVTMTMMTLKEKMI